MWHREKRAKFCIVTLVFSLMYSTVNSSVNVCSINSLCSFTSVSTYHKTTDSTDWQLLVLGLLNISHYFYQQKTMWITIKMILAIGVYSCDVHVLVVCASSIFSCFFSLYFSAIGSKQIILLCSSVLVSISKLEWMDVFKELMDNIYNSIVDDNGH